MNTFIPSSPTNKVDHQKTMAECCSSGQIKTYVFFDLETTGLPSHIKKPRITEISLVAVHRENLISAALDDEPRVIDKLTICLCPMTPIEAVASDITGLWNTSLLFQKDMDEDFVSMLLLFLKRHEQPLCLIAHNGDKFDFPLLHSELASLGRSLPDSVLCVDSLKLLRCLEEDSSYLQRKRNNQSVKDFQIGKRPDVSEGLSGVASGTFEGIPPPTSCTGDVDEERADHPSSPSPSPVQSSPQQPIPRRLYNLKDLHRRILGYDPLSFHRAESDCMSLLRIFHKKSSDLLNLVDGHAIKFNDTTYMYEPSERSHLEPGVFPYHL